MKPESATSDPSVLAMLATSSTARDTQGVIDAALRLFGGECFTISDLTQVGHPVIYASPAFADLTGYAPEEAAGRNLGFLQRDDGDQTGNQEARAALTEGRPCACVVRNYRRDGALFYNEQRHLPILGSDGVARHLLVLQREVTAAIHAAGAESVYRELADTLGGKGASFAYALLLDGSGPARCVWVSEACRAVTGYEPGEVIERGLDDLVLDEDRGVLEASYAALRHGTRQRQGYRLRARDGRVLWVEDFAVPEPEGAGAGSQADEPQAVVAVYGVVRDVSAARQASPELWRGAHFDALTGLPNAHLLDDRLQQALFQARRDGEAVALALVDLDDFRFLNETLGADRGDRVLQEVAGRLRRHLRRTDTLSRLDGDGFAVLLTRLPQARSALPVLDKIQAAVTEPFRDGSATLRLSGSMGVEVFPDGAQNAAELIDHARAALDVAKRESRGGFRFYRSGFDAAMRERVALEQELRRAVLEDQLVLHYQPRVELQSGSITSVEALVRWAHPERGLLKPADFVPLAEEAHLGSELFTWVLERACGQAKRWQQQRTSRRVAVNVSPQALEDADFTRRVLDALTRYDLHPGLLEIEINERTGTSTLEGAGQQLRELRGMGVHVALDDFGVAYSSLSQLRGMPLDGLKIDRSFVERLGGRDAGEDVELVRAIIALGKSLRLTVTAEGIETKEQNSLLRTLACDEGQGFLFSQAVPAEYVPAFA